MWNLKFAYFLKNSFIAQRYFSHLWVGSHPNWPIWDKWSPFWLKALIMPQNNSEPEAFHIHWTWNSIYMFKLYGTVFNCGMRHNSECLLNIIESSTFDGSIFKGIFKITFNWIFKAINPLTTWLKRCCFFPVKHFSFSKRKLYFLFYTSI